MPKLRLAVKKDGALRFLSHLDFARAVRYVIIRADLPVCYSEGFNPHMKINFASALGVGVAADIEYMDMDLMESVPVPKVILRMNEKSPQGFAVLKGKYVGEKVQKLMAAANYATYDLQGPVAGTADGKMLQTLLDQFNNCDEIPYERTSPKNHRSHLINIKEHVTDTVTGTLEGNIVTVQIGILQTSEGSVKPIQVWEVLCRQFGMPAYPDMMLARRTGIYQRTGEMNHSLFEICDETGE